MSVFARVWRDEPGNLAVASPETDPDASELQSGSHEVSPDPRVARVRAAMAPGVMSIVFQPVIDLRRGVVAGAEALARFAMEPRRTPDVWFNEAWDVDLGVELELVAIRRALESLDRLPEGAHLAINASPQTLVSPLLDDVLAGVPGHRLIVELTEHAQVDDYGDIKAAIERLRTRGIRLAIDDAGAGFSSLQHILHLRPDLIKLDRSLTQGIDADPVRYALAAALVTFAVSLDAEICAEGVEKDAELAALQHLGIAYGQGYFLGRPLPLPLAAPPKGVWLHENLASVQHSLRPPRGIPRTEPSRLSMRPIGAIAEQNRGLPVGVDASATRPDEAFDRVTRWTSKLLSAPRAMFGLLSMDRPLWKSSVGLPPSFAGTADALACDSICRRVVSANQCVVSLLDGVSYLAVPVYGPGGQPVGALLAVDVPGREWTKEEEHALVELASALLTELEARVSRALSQDLCRTVVRIGG